MSDSRHRVHEPSSDDGPPLLALRNIAISYRDNDGVEAPAVESVSLTIKEGEFVAIIGPSGCGKSTLLNAIAGLVEPQNGGIEISGIPKGDRLGRVAYMQQRDLLLPWRTVLANARLGLELNGENRQSAENAATERAEQFGLGSVVGSYPWQLSGGMRQRAALLRATLPERKVLLLDEPFGALDAITRRNLQHWLSTVLDRSEKAVLLVTHDIEEALLLADRVYVMSPGPGKIVETIDVSLERPRSDEVVTSPEFISLKEKLMRALSGQAAGAIR